VKGNIAYQVHWTCSGDKDL